MKKAGILNRHLSGEIARLGHTDLVMVCDAGLPIPEGPAVVDLAFRAGTPSFAEVLEGLLDELEVEGAVAASEVRETNTEASTLLDRLFPGSGTTGLQLVPHEELKAMTRQARLVVRTGECRPYANVLLRCGVPF
ncbi:D-ribose pyranase [Streptomyces iconiensis]|uniref:D-ribose pyranase n=1 Tax=Streptomyces iconiensis TaxID=1384038 RepID=A0ABT6ZWA5_9ACTN|nr:D-ribose pyranase [Streptomyces iconiensis]MDJ1133355.1 D-ribose pyranase [Streptomyces iconiensis]